MSISQQGFLGIMINRVSLYWQTIKRLTLGQLWWRFKYTFKRRLIERCGGRVFARIAKDVEGLVACRIATEFDYAPGIEEQYYKSRIEDLLSNKFTFLNESVSFHECVEWHRPEFARGTRLWKLTINYHEYLVDVANRWKKDGHESQWGKWFENHVKEWMRQNPLGTKGYGLDNWNSYALSLRIVAWIRAYAIVCGFMSDDFRLEFVRWLAVQSRFLGENIEYDILGNHIVKNWKALMWAGTFFNDHLLLSKGRKVFTRYIKPQFTASGMHEELSPMYAAIVLGDIQDVMKFADRDDQEIARVEKKLSTCLGYLSFGDDWGRFNDSCAGMALPPEKFMKSHGFFAFDGYVGGRYEDWQWMGDCGAPVVGCQPGHAHCDALSFEYARNGEKIFTNAGVYEYNPGERRSYSRYSRAHNTLFVIGHEQHEMWKAFRCGRLGIARDFNFRHERGSDTWSGEFVAYDKSYTHKRKMNLSKKRILCEDMLLSKNELHGTLNFHLMPEFMAKAMGSGFDIIRIGDSVKVATLKTTGSHALTIKMAYFPEYGEEKMSDVISIDIGNTRAIQTEVIFE